MLQDPFPDKGLMKLAESFGASVFRLCIFLGLTNAEVDNIKLSNPHNAETWGFKALVRWQTNLEKGVSQKDALEKLKNVFTEADRIDLVDVADDLLEQHSYDDADNRTDDNTFKMAAKAGFEEMVKLHEGKLKQVEEKLKEKNDEMQQVKKENNNKMAEVQKENSQKLREKDEENKQLKKKFNNLMAGNPSDKNNLESRAKKLSIPEDKLPGDVVRQFKAYNCACNLPSCLKCQVLPVAEELVGGDSLCEKWQARWQQVISVINSGSSCLQEWRCRYTCPHCHTFDCWSQYWNTVASMLLLCQGQSDACSPRSEVMAMMENTKASSGLCKDKKAWWQRSVNSLQQHRGTLQQWVNSRWRCPHCRSVQCSHQWIPVESKLVTTIDKMFQ